MSNSTDHIEVLRTTLSTVIGVTGFVGNAFVIIVFLTHKKIFNTITNLLILNQSAVDLAVSTVFLIELFQHHLNIEFSSLLVNTIVCKIWTSEYVLWALYICSSMNLVAISLERFCATCHSTKHLNYFTRQRTFVVMAIVWAFGFVYEAHWPLVTEYTNETMAEGYVCQQREREQVVIYAIAGVFFFIVEYVAPVAVMSFSYWKIITMLKNRGKQREFFRRAKHSVTKTLLIVSVIFVICWGPAEIEYFLHNLGVDIDFGGPVHQLGITLVQLNACLNPFIYSLQYKQFKSILKKTFCPSCLGFESDSSSDQGPTSNSITKNANTSHSHSQHYSQNNV